jgi:hypothetical protein
LRKSGCRSVVYPPSGALGRLSSRFLLLWGRWLRWIGIHYSQAFLALSGSGLLARMPQKSPKRLFKMNKILYLI